MTYLCQKCEKKSGVTDFISEIKHVENALILKNWCKKLHMVSTVFS